MTSEPQWTTQNWDTIFAIFEDGVGRTPGSAWRFPPAVPTTLANSSSTVLVDHLSSTPQGPLGLQMPRRCAHCNVPLSTVAIFCFRCGHRFDDTSPTATNSSFASWQHVEPAPARQGSASPDVERNLQTLASYTAVESRVRQLIGHFESNQSLTSDQGTPTSVPLAAASLSRYHTTDGIPPPPMHEPNLDELRGPDSSLEANSEQVEPIETFHRPNDGSNVVGTWPTRATRLDSSHHRLIENFHYVSQTFEQRRAERDESRGGKGTGKGKKKGNKSKSKPPSASRTPLELHATYFVNNSDCSICVFPFEQDDRVVRLQCMHLFHERC